MSQSSPDETGAELSEIDEVRAEHQRLDDLVDEMAERPWLTPEEQTEFARLKRLRLAAKDLIQVLLA